MEDVSERLREQAKHFKLPEGYRPAGAFFYPNMLSPRGANLGYYYSAHLINPDKIIDGEPVTRRGTGNTLGIALAHACIAQDDATLKELMVRASEKL